MNDEYQSNKPYTHPHLTVKRKKLHHQTENNDKQIRPGKYSCWLNGREMINPESGGHARQVLEKQPMGNNAYDETVDGEREHICDPEQVPQPRQQ